MTLLPQAPENQKRRNSFPKSIVMRVRRAHDHCLASLRSALPFLQSAHHGFSFTLFIPLAQVASTASQRIMPPSSRAPFPHPCLSAVTVTVTLPRATPRAQARQEHQTLRETGVQTVHRIAVRIARAAVTAVRTARAIIRRELAGLVHDGRAVVRRRIR